MSVKISDDRWVRTGRDVWKIFRKNTTNKLVNGGLVQRSVALGKPVRSVLVGPVAFAEARAGSIVLVWGGDRLLPEPAEV
jgi:hypothetical protein